MKTFIYLKILLILCCSFMILGSAFTQNSLEDIFLQKRTQSYTDLLKAADQYFQQKHPGKTPAELTRGPFRDGEFVKLMRWNTFWKHRHTADGKLGDLSKNERPLATTQRSNSHFKNLNWENISYTTNLGGKTGLGRTTSMAFHPTDSNIFYVGAAIGGIWKTIDGGKNYIPLGDELPYLAVSSIVVDQTNPDHVYLATGDHLWYGPPSIGVYHSSDAGVTWEETALSFDFDEYTQIYQIVADPTDPAQMYVASSGGLYKTEDGFQSASKIAEGSITDLRFQPGNSAVLYYVREDNGAFFRSEDNGMTFDSITSFQGEGIARLATTPLNPDKVYVTKNLFLHKSFDQGLSFSATTNLDTFLRGGVIMISSLAESTIYGGDINMYKSTDDADSYAQISLGGDDPVLPFVHVDQRSAFVNPLQPKLIYLCNDGGIYSLNVQTDEFVDLSEGLVITQYYDMATAQSDPMIVSGGSQDNGNVHRKGDGEWAFQSGGDGMVQAIDPNDATLRYYSNQYGDIYRVWGNLPPFFMTDKRTGLIPNDAKGGWLTPYVLDPNDPTVVVAGFNKVYKSLTVNGWPWQAISPEFASGVSIGLLAVAPSNSESIYAILNKGLSAQSPYLEGGAQTSIHIKDSLSNNWISNSLVFVDPLTDIMVHPDNANVLYVTLGRYSDGKKVYRSIDGGISWENVSGSLPNVPATAIAYYEGVVPTLFIGTDVGVFYQEEGMTDWELAGDLPNTYITDIEIQESNQLIRVATHGRGMFEAKLENTTRLESLQAANTNCFKVFPNPTSGAIVVADLPSNYTIQLFDMEGKLMTTFEEGQLDLSPFSEGLYYLSFVDRTGENVPCVQKIIKTQ